MSLSVLPDFLERGIANTVQARLERHGVAVAIVGGTCTVFDSTGSVVTTGATVDGPEEGTVEFAVTPASTYQYGEGWRVLWVLVTEDEGTQTVENEAMLVRRRLGHPVSMALVWTLAPQLNPGGGDPITAMTAERQAALLTLAWVRVQTRLMENGKRPFLVVGSSALVEITTHTVLHLIFSALSHSLNEAYAEIAELHRVRCEEAWVRVRLAYDETQDGVVDGRKSAMPSAIWLGRGR